MPNSNQKGKRGERELAKLFRDSGFESARRGQQFKGTPDSPDVLCEELKWLHIECKRTEKLSLYKAMSQAQEDVGDNQIPAVFHKRNGEEWLTVLRTKDFLSILKLRG
jgi:Holliday junction resolvase